MSDEDTFDAIVVGAGPAGLACAYALAREGRQVVLVERGSTPGEKNLTGGRMYAHALELLEPGLCAEAEQQGALERRVEREQVMLLSETGALAVDFRDQGLLGTAGTPDPLPQSWTVLHSRFNAWFAGKVEEAGVALVPGIRVDALLMEGDAVVGVRAGEDVMVANVVVAADGVNSLLAAEAGLDVRVDAHAVGVGIKEVIELPKAVLEQRFHLSGNTGAARVVLGGTNGIPGGGAIYTNRTSVSLACVFNPAEAMKQEVPLAELYQRFKNHPCIRAFCF